MIFIYLFLALTGMVKPLSQLVSHIPQLIECYKMKTTKGLSLSSQHLNTFCGLFGLFMCYFIPPKSAWTYVLYVNSLFQAFTVYICAVIYDGPSYVKESILPI